MVGEGLGDDPSHLARVLALMEQEAFPVHSVDTSPMRLSLFLHPGQLDDVVRALHQAFIDEMDEGPC